MIKKLPVYLLYNFDDIGLQSGKGDNQKVISAADRYFTANSNTSENITVIECCSADSWLMSQFFIFKDAEPMENWIWNSEWLDYFNEQTEFRVNREKNGKKKSYS